MGKIVSKRKTTIALILCILWQYNTITSTPDLNNVGFYDCTSFHHVNEGVENIIMRFVTFNRYRGRKYVI